MLHNQYNTLDIGGKCTPIVTICPLTLYRIKDSMGT